MGCGFNGWHLQSANHEGCCPVSPPTAIRIQLAASVITEAAALFVLQLRYPESHQQELTLIPRERRKRALLESTDDFPTDFQFSSSRRVRSRQLQNSSDYPRPDTPTIAQSGEHRESAGTAVSNSAHKRRNSQELPNLLLE
ncbi:hypothetical protein EJB05_13181 [Eragrostis curvula]|uniref:Uncharacterized protein n=1 Tax=Eragrostis curvula TaxID=38414 RepID=A0A5J9VTE7_9POAL|nr:hypothetical protein EJB05_13181 [Eragrostis curvula]